ncbi:MAG TPA: tRNA pseudouridine(55) synthase TruB [Vitreimonas sp.]|nr:tRNA pseudouridine(55) synthase TruB [Vitreimonas sp.]
MTNHFPALPINSHLPTRDETGIFLIDKPTGWTSFDVVNKIRSLTKVKRVGHAGTLDPLATGLLIVFVGREFTKYQDQFMKADKVYDCTAQLGVLTDTLDSDGEVLQIDEWEKLQAIKRETIEQVLPNFYGTITQIAPLYSAIKINGKKLYEYGYQKLPLDVELPERTVSIHQLELIEFHHDATNHKMTFSIRVACSSGTYIRSLVRDIGIKLGTFATVIALRRTHIGDLTVQNAIKLL